MDSKTLYDAKNYWNDIKIFILPILRKEFYDERIEYLIQQIEVSLDTNDTSMFDFDTDEEVKSKDREYSEIYKIKKFDIKLFMYIVIIYDLINFMKDSSEQHLKFLKCSFGFL